MVLALPPIALELYHGNVHLLMAAAIALGFRYPWTWAFVLLTKVTPGRRRAVVRGATRVAVTWRSRSESTAAISLVTFVVAPHYWSEWIASIFSNLSEPQFFSVPPAAPIRLPIAVVLLFWGARTDRPWTVADRRDPGTADHLAARPDRRPGGDSVPAPRRSRRGGARLGAGRRPAWLRHLRGGVRRWRAAASR